MNWRRGNLAYAAFLHGCLPTTLFSFYDAQSTFRVALCDSFNTPDALNALREIVSKTNVYINSRGKQLNIFLVENIGRWVGDMLRVFGLGEGEKTELGWGQAEQGSENINVSLHPCFFIHLPYLKHVKREEILMPYLRALSSFRDGVRQLAIAKGDTALKDILAMCDKLRDVDLVPLGVALDDQDGGFSQSILLQRLTSHHFN
jgi:cysteinyl-tRNA synthetase